MAETGDDTAGDGEDDKPADDENGAGGEQLRLNSINTALPSQKPLRQTRKNQKPN